jgi:hypothetical protein
MDTQQQTKNTQLTILLEDFDISKLTLVPDKRNGTRFYLNYNKNRVFAQFPPLELSSYGLNIRFGQNDKEKLKLTVPVDEKLHKSVFKFGKDLDNFMTSGAVTKVLGVKANKYVTVVRTPENTEQSKKFNTKVKGIFNSENCVKTITTSFFKKDDTKTEQVFPNTLNEVMELLSYRTTLQPIMGLSVWKYLGKYGVSLQMESVRVTPNENSNSNTNTEYKQYISKYNNPFISDSDEEPVDEKQEQKTTQKVDENDSDSSSDSDSSEEEVVVKKTRRKGRGKSSK